MNREMVKNHIFAGHLPVSRIFHAVCWCPFYHPKLRAVRSASGREHDSARGQGEGEPDSVTEPLRC